MKTIQEGSLTEILCLPENPYFPHSLVNPYILCFQGSCCPARQGSRLTRLGVFGPPGWNGLSLSLGLWFNPHRRHYFHTGSISHWIKLEYWTNKRTRGLPVSFHQGGGFFCSCPECEILFVVIGVSCEMVLASMCMRCLDTSLRLHLMRTDRKRV